MRSLLRVNGCARKQDEKIKRPIFGFIKIREPGYEKKTIREIAREMFSYAGNWTMSGKKDGLVNMGGFLAVNDDEPARQARHILIVTAGLILCSLTGLTGFTGYFLAFRACRAIVTLSTDAGGMKAKRLNRLR